MIAQTQVEIYSFSAAKNSQGIPIKTYSLLKTIWADVQPKALTEVQATAWGVDVKGPDSKLVFYDTDPAIHELYRAIVNGMTYDIRGINVWPRHSEMILVPVPGEAVQRFCLSPDAVRVTNASYVWMDAEYWDDANAWIDGV